MKKSELIKRLEKIKGDPDVMILDGFNGGGHPREINLGPYRSTITGLDDQTTADCEGRRGERIVVIGYGCY